MIATANENTILIPGGAVLRNLGDGAIYLLGLASDEIGNATDVAEAPRRPEYLTEAFERFDRARALLDAIGWQADNDVRVPAEHAELIGAALREEVRMLGDMSASAVRQGDQEVARRRSGERKAVAEYLAKLEGGGA